jgi:hypothetical protein
MLIGGADIAPPSREVLSMKRSVKFAVLGSSVALAASSIVGGAASADAGQTVKPSKQQKAAVVKAWSKWDGGKAYKGPQKCMKVELSKSNTGVAGLKTNADRYPKSCAEYAFDGTAFLYGSKNRWFLLTEGSSQSNAQCRALKNLLDADVWQDLVDYADGMGCHNID